jgi:hypothetical protein
MIYSCTRALQRPRSKWNWTTRSYVLLTTPPIPLLDSSSPHSYLCPRLRCDGRLSILGNTSSNLPLLHLFKLAAKYYGIIYRHISSDSDMKECNKTMGSRRGDPRYQPWKCVEISRRTVTEARKAKPAWKLWNPKMGIKKSLNNCFGSGMTKKFSHSQAIPKAL